MMMIILIFEVRGAGEKRKVSRLDAKRDQDFFLKNHALRHVAEYF
jgi:hypothetical protein